jgi:hypothetical protein
MKRSDLSRQPYDLLLAAAILIAIASLFVLGQQLDIHFHDTFFVFPIALFYWSAAIILIVLWALYLILRKLKSKQYLTWLHVTATLLFFLILLTEYFWESLILSPLPRDTGLRYSDIAEWQKREFQIYITIGLLFVFGQLCLILNILYGLGSYVRNWYIDNSKRHP